MAHKATSNRRARLDFIANNMRATADWSSRLNKARMHAQGSAMAQGLGGRMPLVNGTTANCTTA